MHRTLFYEPVHNLRLGWYTSACVNTGNMSTMAKVRTSQLRKRHRNNVGAKISEWHLQLEAVVSLYHRYLFPSPGYWEQFQVCSTVPLVEQSKWELDRSTSLPLMCYWIEHVSEIYNFKQFSHGILNVTY